jgi:flagellar hook protein FlgE
MSRTLTRWLGTAVLFGTLVGHPELSWSLVDTNSGTGIEQTDVCTDLAITGAGWFILRSPTTGQMYVTRRGDFHVNADGFVVSSIGQRVQGYSDTTLSTLGDMRVDCPGTHSGARVWSYSFTSNGKLIIILSDGARFVRGQVLLQNFRAPELLPHEAYNLYALTTAAGPLPQPVAPGSAGLGELLSGWLDATPELVRLSLLPSASKTGPLTEGVLTGTYIPTDLGIQGAGFFLVRDTNNSTLFATRAGMFLTDAGGYLITYDRLRVQGYSDVNLSIPGDLRIDPTGATAASPDAAVIYFTFEQDGKLKTYLSDGTCFVRGQILLSAFAHPERLTPTNHGLYAGITQAQPQPVALSHLRQYALELINVPADLLAQRQTLSFFVQGCITSDEITTHLALAGEGFFVLRNPNDSRQYVTRAGAFNLDTNGYLVNSDGLRVQGYDAPALTTIGDIRVDSAGSAAVMSSFWFDNQGFLAVALADGTRFVRGQVLLQGFREPFLLKSTGTTLYTNLTAAVPLPHPVGPCNAGLGSILGGGMEVPNPTEQLTLPSRNGIRLKITGEPGRRWAIQASSALGQWTPFMQITNVSSELEFTDTDSIHLDQRFYRVEVSEP